MILITGKLIRFFIWLTVVFLIAVFAVFYTVGDINKLKSAIEKNLKSQLNCAVQLGELEWDLDGLKLGFTTKSIFVLDLENNIILQGGQTRFVWEISKIIFGKYSHFHTIDSSDLFIKIIRDKNNTWNLVSIFPPGPPPKVDNLVLHNSIIHLTDELNPRSKHLLCKELNLSFKKKPLSKTRNIELTSKIGSLSKQAFLKLKGEYTDSKKFQWNKNKLNLFLAAKDIELANWYYYASRFIRGPEIKDISGEFTGVVSLRKNIKENLIDVGISAKTNNFVLDFENKEISQIISIPKTDLSLRAIVKQNDIQLITLKSRIDDLVYELSGSIHDWSASLPEADLIFKTNKFNFKKVKPYLPVSLLPAGTRERVEPINDDGFVEIDIGLTGPLISPRYKGTILLSDFNLTSESGFLSAIKGLNGKLVLEDKLLKIDYLNIPLGNSTLSLKGEVDDENLKNKFNLQGAGLDIANLLNLATEAGYKSSFLDEVKCNGKADFMLEVENETEKPPKIMGNLTFHDAGAVVYKGELLELKNVFGEFLLDGSKARFNNVSGLINNEGFYIHGDLSLEEDQSINLLIEAKRLKVIPYIISHLSEHTSLKPVLDSITGEASDLNLNIRGSLFNPALFGMLLLNDISFRLPGFEDQISSLKGSLNFEGNELIVDSLSGKIQDTDFVLAGYIEDLLGSPKPRLRLVTNALEISNLWNYLKERLSKTSLKEQAEQIETLNGFASTDLFIYPDSVLGNIFFNQINIKHKVLPFGLSNLEGRLVIGDKNLGLFGLTGNVSNANNFTGNLTVFNYLSPKFYVQGMLNLEFDIPQFLSAIQYPAIQGFKVEGLVPTYINFDFSYPVAGIGFYSILDKTLKLDLDPYFKKPVDKDYTISGDISFDVDKQNAYINEIAVKADKLSLISNGSINNISSMSPELMIYFTTTEPAGLFMLVEPVAPLMGLKAWGMADISGAISGSPSHYAFSSVARITDIRLPEIFGKKLKAGDALINFYLDSMQGTLNSQIKNISYASLMAKSVSFSATYLEPLIYLNELALDGDPGSIYAVGSFNSKNNLVTINANGSNLELASLGSFILLDPEKISGITDFALMIESSGRTKENFLSQASGNVTFSVADGKLGQIALLHKGLQFANIFGQGIFGFNLKNILSLFFKYQDGSFNNVKGEIDLQKGLVKFKDFTYRAKDLLLNSFGFLDLKKSLIHLLFYGYLPEDKEAKNGAISIIPESVGKKRFFIPFLSSNPPRHFKFEIKGDIKNPKKISSRARRSFKWLKGRKLKKEYKLVPTFT